jgi:hypothetical protein
MSDKFSPLGHSEITSLLQACQDDLPPGFSNAEKLEAMARPLNFYPGSRLIELKLQQQISSMPVCVFASSKGSYRILDWHPQTIYQLNGEEDFSLSFGNVVEYVKFFFRYTRVPEGRLLIVENLEEFAWREEPPLAVRKALSSMIKPVILNMWDEEQKRFQVSAHLLYQNNLFEANIEVDRSGQIQIVERVLQVEDVPLLDDITAQ